MMILLVQVAVAHAVVLPAIPDLISTAEHLPDLLHRNFSVIFVQSHEVMPKVEQIDDMDAAQSERRAYYFGSLMVMMYMATLLIGTAIMTLGPRCCTCLQRSSHSREYEAVADPDAKEAKAQRQKSRRRLLVSSVFTTIFATSLAAAGWSLSTDRLSKRFGLDWELYCLLFLLNCLWLEVQAIVAATRAAQTHHTFAATAFFEGTISAAWPVISDTYDTLKDVLVGALCVRSDSMVLKVLGITSWVYLVAIHFVFLGWFPLVKQMVDGDKDNPYAGWWIEDLVGVRFLSEDMADRFLAEMLGSYAPVMVCPTALKQSHQKPEDDVWCSCFLKMCSRSSNFLSGMAYKQVTLVKRCSLAIENIFQGLVGIAYIVIEGGSIFVAVLNVAIPILQILLAFFLHKPLRRQAAPWFAKRLTLALENKDLVMEEQIREEAFEDMGIFTAVAPHLADYEGFTELTLNFSSHGIDDAGAVELGAKLGHLQHLTKLTLDLMGNAIGSSGAVALAEALRGLPNLQRVNVQLQGNVLGDWGTAAWEQLREELRSRGCIVVVAERRTAVKSSSTGQFEMFELEMSKAPGDREPKTPSREDS